MLPTFQNWPKYKSKWQYLLILLLFSFNTVAQQSKETEKQAQDYSDLLIIFEKFRAMEAHSDLAPIPDYTPLTMAKKSAILSVLRSRLSEIDTTGWPVPKKVDWMIVWAEMNGFDFNHRVLKPWARDPAFYKTVWTYKSDVPAHEGPTHHALTELWTYQFPLSKTERERLINDLQVIPPLNQQAMKNLTGNAKDLWITGIRDIETQSKVLSDLKNKKSVKKDKALVRVIDNAIVSTEKLASWLKEQAKSKTGPSGIGKENYTWYLQNVHLVPLTWADEVMILDLTVALS